MWQLLRETPRGCNLYRHLRQLLNESTGTLKQCRQNARFLGVKGDFRIYRTFRTFKGTKL